MVYPKPNLSIKVTLLATKLSYKNKSVTNILNLIANNTDWNDINKIILQENHLLKSYFNYKVKN